MAIKTLFIGDFPEDIIKENVDISPSFISVQDAKDSTPLCLERVKNAQAIVSRSGCLYAEQVLKHAPELKLLIKAGAGTDMIDHEYCKAHGISVMNTPGTNAQSVAELAIGLLVTLARHVVPLHKGLEDGKWLRTEYKGEEITGKNVAIIGYGYIGRRTAKLLKLFNCSVTVYDPTLSEQEKDSAVLDGLTIATCENCAVKEMDFIILHPSYNTTSHYFINQKKVSKMKQGVKILNLARGSVIDQEAVLDGLKTGVIGGLAIDCWWEEPPKENPFREFKNVIMTPHIGANTKEALLRSTTQALKIIKEHNWNDAKE